MSFGRAIERLNRRTERRRAQEWPGALMSRQQRLDFAPENRVVLRVSDLPRCIESLKRAGLRLRNSMQVGPGGRQIQLEDPDGNPIELFEPAS